MESYDSDWVPLAAYHVDEVRPKIPATRQQEVEEELLMPEKPHGWVSIVGYHVRGERAESKQPPKAETIFDEDEVAQEESAEPLPPEALITTDEALAEVYAVKQEENSPIARGVAEMAQMFQEMAQEGRIDQEQLQERLESLEQIRQARAQTAEDISAWYVETFFRPLDGSQETEEEAA
ncbi:MAG: hypothetical protein HQL50_09605 [Magnetococcales bacterium]|nr:hypothetical protein [Magnetococcales bacterium]